MEVTQAEVISVLIVLAGGVGLILTTRKRKDSGVKVKSEGKTVVPSV